MRKEFASTRKKKLPPSSHLERFFITGSNRKSQKLSPFGIAPITPVTQTTNAADNNKRSRNQQVGRGCKHPSRNNLPRIKLIRDKLFPDRYQLPMTAYLSQQPSLGNRCAHIHPKRYQTNNKLTKMSNIVPKPRLLRTDMNPSMYIKSRTSCGHKTSVTVSRAKLSVHCTDQLYNIM